MSTNVVSTTALTDTFSTLFSHLWESKFPNLLSSQNLKKKKKKKKKKRGKKIPPEMESVCSIRTAHFIVKYNKVKHPTWHQVTSQPAKMYLKGTLIEAQVKDKCMYIICDRGNTREMGCLYLQYPLTDTHKTKSIDCILSSEQSRVWVEVLQFWSIQCLLLARWLKIKSETILQNLRGYLKNSWINTRLVCTHFKTISC